MINTLLWLGKATSCLYLQVSEQFGTQERLILINTTVLHPGMRLNFFQDEDVWGEMMHRGRALLQHLFDTYKDELEQPAHEIDGSNRQQPHTKSQKLSWSDQLLELSASPPSALDDELTRFFGNIYPYERGTNVLKWWMVRAPTVISRPQSLS